jgi:glycosyltransferase involved in cell wall biosynthesis
MRSKIPVFLLSTYKGWILEAKMRESALASKTRIRIVFIPTLRRDFFNIPLLIKYFSNKTTRGVSIFINQNSYFKSRTTNLMVFNPAYSKVFYTHYTDIGIPKAIYASMLNECKEVFVNNRNDKMHLIDLGVEKHRIKVVYGAVDRNLFYPKTKGKRNSLKLEGNPYVLIAGHCKSRKNPNLVISVINSMPNVKFIIHGEGWDTYFISHKYNIPNNLELLSFRMNRQPELMRNASTYLTLSTLESGPYPTLEALASGTPVVATDTGWNSEVVNHKNGVLLPVNVSVNEVKLAIEQTIILKKSLQTKDLLKGMYTWEQLGQKLYF